MTVAINVDQPYASLLAHGIKLWETRPFPPAGWPLDGYTGRRMPGCRITPETEALVVSSRKRPTITHLPGFTDITGEPRAEGADCAWLDCRSGPNTVIPLPLGAVVARGRVTDVVPITHYADGEHEYRDFIDWFPTEALGPEALVLFRDRCSGPEISDQLPYGDWAPGRWAWRMELTPLAEAVREYPCRCGWCRQYAFDSDVLAGRREAGYCTAHDAFGWCPQVLGHAGSHGGSLGSGARYFSTGDQPHPAIPVRGRQGVWRPDPALVEAVEHAIGDDS